MKLRYLSTLFMASLMALGSSTVSAAMITPVAVKVSSVFSSYSGNNLIDGSGLNGGLHGTKDTGMWLSAEGDTQATLTFNLGAVYGLTSAYIWQYNPSSGGASSGVKGLKIFTSLDNVLFNLVANASLKQAPGNASVAAQTIDFNSFGQGVKYVKFLVLSNYGETYTGLSEVKFGDEPPMSEQQSSEDPASAPVPEMNASALLVLAFLGLCLSRSKKIFLYG
jgi:hypothetical protein